MNYTPWFDIGDSTQRPRRIGVYQLRSPAGPAHYSKWDGMQWLMTCATAREASHQTLPSWGVKDYFYTKWRGLLNA